MSRMNSHAPHQEDRITSLQAPPAPRMVTVRHLPEGASASFMTALANQEVA
nr:hypothetical protein [uncultured Chitinophaga sp.]